MRKPTLTFDAILTAMAALAPLAATACSRAEHAAPEATTPASPTATPTPSPTTTPVAPPEASGAGSALNVAPTAAAPKVESAERPDAGGGGSIGRKPGAHANCGAAGCSPEMRKGK